jgi:hypothetical protein
MSEANLHTPRPPPRRKGWRQALAVLLPTPHVGAAIVLGFIAIVIGGYVFQASAVSFEYMKLRDFALFESSSSLPQFASRMETIGKTLEPEAEGYRTAQRDRFFLAADIAARQRAAQEAVTEVAAALGLDKATPTTFLDVEQRLRASCPDADDVAAAALMTAAGMEALKAPATPPPAQPPEKATQPEASDPGGAKAPAKLDAYCKVDPKCPAPAELTAAKPRVRLICAQAAFLDAQKRSEEEFKSDRYYAAALRFYYPGFSDERAAEAVRIAEVYRTVACGPGIKCLSGPICTAATPDSERGKSCQDRNWVDVLRFHVWNWWFGWPLAILYLVLAMFFGMVGGLSRHLYETARESDAKAKPAKDSADPQAEAGGSADEASRIGALFERLLAGGGAAVLVLLLIMAGFQFLTVGTSQPDLAYPNPLTVCAVSVLTGLSGSNVLHALQSFAGRFFGGAPASDKTDKDRKEAEET